MEEFRSSHFSAEFTSLNSILPKLLAINPPNIEKLSKFRMGIGWLRHPKNSITFWNLLSFPSINLSPPSRCFGFIWPDAAEFQRFPENRANISVASLESEESKLH